MPLAQPALRNHSPTVRGEGEAGGGGGEHEGIPITIAVGGQPGPPRSHARNEQPVGEQRPGESVVDQPPPVGEPNQAQHRHAAENDKSLALQDQQRLQRTGVATIPVTTLAAPTKAAKSAAKSSNGTPPRESYIRPLVPCLPPSSPVKAAWEAHQAARRDVRDLLSASAAATATVAAATNPRGKPKLAAKGTVLLGGELGSRGANLRPITAMTQTISATIASPGTSAAVVHDAAGCGLANDEGVVVATATGDLAGDRRSSSLSPQNLQQSPTHQYLYWETPPPLIPIPFDSCHSGDIMLRLGTGSGNGMRVARERLDNRSPIGTMAVGCLENMTSEMVLDEKLARGDADIESAIDAVQKKSDSANFGVTCGTAPVAQESTEPPLIVPPSSTDLAGSEPLPFTSNETVFVA
ncbi:hypothetical protein DFJ73DRAFT_840614 [Zopfochytrium polystomum]|nr:hypothetical protein DFJ73DRAFT_840614 [Zopfochytrium polystomum]